MATRVLSNSDIDNLCQYFINAPFPYYESLREALKVMYLTGCRLSEAFEIWRWTWVTDYDFHLEPQKGNVTRIVTLSSECDNFRAAVVNQYAPFLGRTKYQLDYLLLHIKTFNSIKVDGKFRLSYLYRYNYVKMRFQNGDSVNVIAASMGYTSNTTTQAYLDAELIENFDLPPIPVVEVGGAIWMQHCLNIDDGLGGIVFPNLNIANVDRFGLLYNHAAANRVASSVLGFRVPTVEDFQALSLVEGYYSNNWGRYLRSINVGDWNFLDGTNRYGFSDKGAGRVHRRNYVQDFLSRSFLWTNTQADWTYYTFRNTAGISAAEFIIDDYRHYQSVRLIAE